jgi:hypothetical protein
MSLELWSRAHDVPALRQWISDARSRRQQAFQRVLDQGQAIGEIRRYVVSENAAASLMAIADGLVVQRSCAPFMPLPGDASCEVDGLLAHWRSPLTNA